MVPRAVRSYPIFRPALGDNKHFLDPVGLGEHFQTVAEKALFCLRQDAAAGMEVVGGYSATHRGASKAFADAVATGHAPRSLRAFTNALAGESPRLVEATNFIHALGGDAEENRLIGHLHRQSIGEFN